MSRIDLIEVCALYLPIVLAVLCWYYFKRVTKVSGALILSFLLSFVLIFAVNQVAFYFDWWSYSGASISYHGVPVSIWFGWSIAWGIVVPLLPFRGSVIVIFALISDLLLMPLLEPLLILKSNWIYGELLALGGIVIPSVLFYKWTILKRSLNLKVMMQGVIFFWFVGFFIPDLILTYLEGRSFTFPEEKSSLIRGIQVNVLFFWCVLGISSVREFMKQGGGTPVPYDPPQRMVQSGLYAYMSNPMQLSTVGAVLTYAWLLESWGVFGAAIMVVVYSLGVALPSEAIDLSNRFGDDWVQYKQQRKPFLPSWRSFTTGVTPAEIYFAENCSTCSFIGFWLRDRQPRDLNFKGAKTYEGEPLRRLTYIQGAVRYEGVDAFARGISHIHLGWAIIGCFIQFPGISSVLQLIADAGMFGSTLQEEEKPRANVDSDPRP